MGIPSYYKNLIIKYNNIKTDINDINIDEYSKHKGITYVY